MLLRAYPNIYYRTQKSLQYFAGFIFLVRSSGFEPPRGCPRQPLKLVRLPFRHDRIDIKNVSF